MPKLLRNAVVLAKLEVTYGVDPVPTTANGILCTKPDVKVVGEKVVRDFIRSSLSPLGHVVGVRHQTISFSAELKGSGVQLTPSPLLDPLFRACGLIPTADVYEPVSAYSTIKSCTIYYYMDGILHKMTGCRGNCSFEFPVGGFPKVTFTMTGRYVAPSDQALVTNVTYNTNDPPLCLSAGLVIDAYTPVGVETISLDLGNQVQLRKDINSSAGITEVIITGRDTKGSINPEVDTLANFNPFALFLAGTKKALSWTIGSVAGNTVVLAIPEAQLDEPSYQDRNGIATYQIPFVCTGEDDELSLSFT